MVAYRKEINEKTRTIKRYDQSTNTLRREKDELKKQISLLKEDNSKVQGEKTKSSGKLRKDIERAAAGNTEKQLQEDVVKIRKS